MYCAPAQLVTILITYTIANGACLYGLIPTMRMNMLQNHTPIDLPATVNTGNADLPTLTALQTAASSARSGKWDSFTLELKTVTPMYGGGIHPGQTDRQLRPSAAARYISP